MTDCGDCHLCCTREMIVLVDGDDPSLFEGVIPVPREWLAPALPSFSGYVISHRADGACIHLGDDGCKVYAIRPDICRVFSCESFVAKCLAETTRKERRKSRIIDKDIWRAGMRRLRQSKDPGDAQ